MRDPKPGGARGAPQPGASRQRVDWFGGGTPSRGPPGHAGHVMEIIESRYRAAGTGRTQELTTRFDLAS